MSWRGCIAETRAPLGRTLAGLAKARKEGRVGGRPKVVCDYNKVARLRKAGKTLVEIADAAGVSKSTVHRLLA